MIELNGKIEKFTFSLSIIDKTIGKTINKTRVDLNNTINQLDLIDTNKTLHPTSAEYTFFSEHSGTFSRIEHMLGHEMSLNKF